MVVKNATPVTEAARSLHEAEKRVFSMLAREDGILIGLTSHALLLFGNENAGFGRRLATYSSIFSMLELDFTLPTLPTDSMLQSILEQRHLNVLWHFKLNDLIADEHTPLSFFERPEWNGFITMLLQNTIEDVDERYTLILSFHRSVEHSEALAEKLIAMVEALYPLRTAFEFEHGSWKKSEKIFSALQIAIVQLDTPKLPGLIRPIRNTNKRTAFLRLVGRNPRTWLNHQDEDRFTYHYNGREIEDMLQKLRAARTTSDKVFVTCATFPAQLSLETATSLAQGFVRRQTLAQELNSA